MGENHIDENEIDDEELLLGDAVRNIESTWNEQIHQYELLSEEE